MFGRPTLKGRLAAQLIATTIGLLFLFPLIAIVRVSFEGEGLVTNYTTVLLESPLFKFAGNSLIISASTIAIVYASTMLAGYAFAKLKFTGRNLLFYSILAGLVLPGITLVVPLFVAVQRLHLFDNYLSVIIPMSATMIPFTLLLARNYFAGIPDEILEAAKLDGCTSFSTLVRIVLPLSRPITAVVVLWVFLSSWNEFFLPLLFLQDPAMQVVTQVPTYFTGVYTADTPKIFAVLVLVSLPVVILYLSMQKLFEAGLTSGSIK